MASRTFCSAGEASACNGDAAATANTTDNKILINIGIYSKYAEKRDALKER